MNKPSTREDPDTLLTLLFPADVESIVIEHLLEHPEWAPGFTCFAVDGHGGAMVPRDQSEQVRGRARRFEVQIVLSARQASALIGHFRETMGNAEVAYWTVALREFGSLS